MGVSQETGAIVDGLMDRYREDLEHELRRALGGRDLPLYDMARYHMGWADERGRPVTSDPGKRLRPLLCLLACEAVSGDHHPAIPAAAGLELVHNFTLVHDDVMDEDRERRHRPTVWALWGKPQAINVGDLLYSRGMDAMLSLAERGLDHARALAAVRRLEETCVEVIEGQYLDLEFEKRSQVTVAEYLQMIGKKSAALIGCSMEIGALVGGAEPAVQARFAETGRAMGLAFQIRDDMLGIWGDPGVTGKPVGADVRRRKKSLPAICAFALAAGGELERLRAFYGAGPPSEAEVAQVLEIMRSLGVRDAVQDMAGDHADAAAAKVRALPIAEDGRRRLQTLLEFFVQRQA